MDCTARTIGERLRSWRQRRSLSQLGLALRAEISTRHLSFLETGRAAPSREMVLRLASELDVPLRERNALLLAAGFAPRYPERTLDDAALEVAKRSIEALLTAHEPFPALAIDRHWNLVAANSGARRLMEGAAPHLLEPPVNVVRVSLHPEGVASKIENLGDWKAHLMHRLRRQFDISSDSKLQALITETQAYPAPPPRLRPDPSALAMPLRIRSKDGPMQFLTATMLFGAPVEVTLAEIAIEIFLPADHETLGRFRGAQQ